MDYVRGLRKRALHMRIYRALLRMYRALLRIPNPLLEAASAMGLLRLVGSLKLQVSFAERSLLYRALWQKRPIITLSRLTVSHDSFAVCHGALPS